MAVATYSRKARKQQKVCNWMCVKCVQREKELKAESTKKNTEMPAMMPYIELFMSCEYVAFMYVASYVASHDLGEMNELMIQTQIPQHSTSQPQPAHKSFPFPFTVNVSAFALTLPPLHHALQFHISLFFFIFPTPLLLNL